MSTESNQYTGLDRRSGSDAHWTFKKEIQITHVISTLLLALSAWGYISNMEKRISMMEEKLIVQRERDDKQDVRYAEMFVSVKAQIDKMDAKLDRLIERK